MPPTNVAEEIIEKKPGSPIATVCVILSIVAVLGAIAFQIAEIGEYRKGTLGTGQRTPGASKAQKDADALHTRAEEILTRPAPGGNAASGLDDAKGVDAKSGEKGGDSDPKPDGTQNGEPAKAPERDEAKGDAEPTSIDKDKEPAEEQ